MFPLACPFFFSLLEPKSLLPLCFHLFLICAQYMTIFSFLYCLLYFPFLFLLVVLCWRFCEASIFLKFFLDKIKVRYSGACHSLYCSTTFFKMIIWSIALCPFLNPACSFLSFWSISFAILSIMMLPNTLLGMDSSVIPLQLEQFTQITPLWQCFQYPFAPFFRCFLVIPDFVV